VPEPENLVPRLRGGDGNSPCHEPGTEGAHSPENGTEVNCSSESEDDTAGPNRCFPCARSFRWPFSCCVRPPPPVRVPGGRWFRVCGRPTRDRRYHALRPQSPVPTRPHSANVPHVPLPLCGDVPSSQQRAASSRLTW
jgi:hypothetical protein